MVKCIVISTASTRTFLSSQKYSNFSMSYKLFSYKLSQNIYIDNEYQDDRENV